MQAPRIPPTIAPVWLLDLGDVPRAPLGPEPAPVTVVVVGNAEVIVKTWDPEEVTKVEVTEVVITAGSPPPITV
jgi:hypothetical protein